MGCLMEDPVKLPTSGKIVDRKTIYRHLLKYVSFNDILYTYLFVIKYRYTFYQLLFPLDYTYK